VTFAADIRCRLAQSVAIALTFASIGSGLFSTVPAAAAAQPHASHFDSDGIRPRVPLVPGAPRAIPRAASSNATSLTCDSQFHQVAGANPGTAINVIQNNGLAAISPTDVWAVGFKADFTTGNTIGPDAPMAERWDGSSWTYLPVANPAMIGGHTDLNGVATVPGATTSPNNVFVVGNTTFYGTDPMHPLAEQWTAGTSTGGWNPIGAPNLGTGDNFLYGVAAITASNVWAVGSWRQDNIVGTRRQTLIGHWDGTTFTSIAGPDPTSTSSDRLAAAAASGANDVWAVGVSVDGGIERQLILHYDGSMWSIKPTPNPSNTGNLLYGVTAISPTLAYAVGAFFDPSGYAHALVEKWDGTAWSLMATPSLDRAHMDNFLFSVSALSANNIWAAGASYSPNQTLSPSDTLVAHWDGAVWKALPSPDGATGSFNELNAILATPTSAWTAGDYLNSAGTQGLTLFENMCISPPTVTGVLPVSGNTVGNYGLSTVAISGADFNFATAVKFGTADATGWRVDSNNQITAAPPDGVAGTVDVTVTNSAGTSATSSADTYIYVPRAISWQQYSLTGSDGATWQPIDATALTVAFQPSADSKAIISGNADLWTSMAGVNQDIGLMVTGMEYGSGTIVAWKESGGYAGTFSPNAAFVQTVIPVTKLGLYGVELIWKSNKPTAGTIFAAAGAGPSYSPSRLTVEMVTTTPTIEASAATNTQYLLNGNDGNTWMDMDATNLMIANFTPAATSTGLVSANADLWTTAAGVNQDIGIWISGGSYGSGTLVGWKEGGGYGGTFSPNAAFVQTFVTLTATTKYTIELRWKTNKLTSSTIVAGAGAGPVYSPTQLTLRLFPTANTLLDGSTNKQYNKAGSTGADWTPVDSTGLQITVNPTDTSVWVLSANADLFTATAGVNQDIGIFISGGAYGAGTLVAWKESGGYGGTFSPNAAFVQTVIPLQMGVSYTITLEWKANKATGGTIYAGAGAGPSYSPTRITAQLLN
jgi:hypothetical protein